LDAVFELLGVGGDRADLTGKVRVAVQMLSGVGE
jgi:hypothetical protein